MRTGIREMMAYKPELETMTIKVSETEVEFISKIIDNINHVPCLNEFYEIVSEAYKSKGADNG